MVFIDVWKKYRAGDPLTNEELDILLPRISITADMVGDLGPEFFLAAKELYLARNDLKRMIEARGIK